MNVRNVQCFGLTLISRSVKTFRYKTPLSTYLVEIFSGYPTIYRSSMTVQAKQNVPDLCAGVSIESRATMLTETAPATPSLTCCRAKVDFREAQVPFYKNGRKSGLNLPWLERAVCWKRQEVSGILITHWNEASRALPVLALNSNYLDCWPNDWGGRNGLVAV